MKAWHKLACVFLSLSGASASAQERQNIVANPNAYPFDRSKLLAFNPIEKCDSPNQSPNCVAKTVAGCFLPGARHADCVRVGFDIPDIPPEKDQRFDESRPAFDIGGEPWKRSWKELSAKEYYIFTATLRPMAVRTVGAERFTASPPLDPELMGTHEVILFQGTIHSLAVITSTSIFMKETRKGWQAVSYSSDFIRYIKDENTPGDAECSTPICKYYAKGVAPADVPIDIHYPSAGMPPVFLPDQDLLCAETNTGSPFCEFDN
jgi:hypothetical protein